MGHPILCEDREYGPPASIRYDGAGDIDNDGVNQYLYDGDGRICAVMSQPLPSMTTMTGYIYDADGARVSKGTISSWSCDPVINGFQPSSDYVLGLSGEQVTEMSVGANGAMIWQHTNVYAAGSLLATYDQGGLHFYLNDPLGTRRAQTDYAGVPEQTCSSLPFGNGLACTGSNQYPTEHHLTGKERDTESGNDYFGARYYGSNMGRWMSPDPSMASSHAANPQSWNRYSYSLGNPLKYIDPDGKEAEVFYRPPDPNLSSVKDFGHVFIFVRNDKTGRSGYFDYYPDPRGSAVHRSVQPTESRPMLA